MLKRAVIPFLSSRVVGAHFGVLGSVPRSYTTAQRKPTVLLTYQLPKPAMDLLKSAPINLHTWPGMEPMSTNELHNFLAQHSHVDGIICTLNDKFDGRTLFTMDRAALKVLSTVSVGFDHIDVDICTENDILVGNTPGCLTDATADLTMSLMLAAARRLPDSMAAVRSGEWGAWKPEWMLGKDFTGSTVGIVGLGRIGQAVARRLRGFDCELLYHSPRRAAPEIESGLDIKYEANLESLLGKSDYVTLHCPLTTETTKLMNDSTLGHMKRGSVLVNTTRGPVVDLAALERHFQAGTGPQIAALDVTDPEPLPPSHPLLDDRYSSQCLIVPHIGSATTATRNRMATIAVQNCLRALNVGVVDVEGHFVNAK